RLPHLVHLYLSLKFPDFIEGHSPATVQLPSIKSLCFYPEISSHDNFAALNLDWVFLNVQIADLCIFTHGENVCSICDIEDFFKEDDKKWQEKKQRCLRMFLSPFARIPQIRRLEVDGECVDEFVITEFDALRSIEMPSE